MTTSGVRLSFTGRGAPCFCNSVARSTAFSRLMIRPGPEIEPCPSIAAPAKGNMTDVVEPLRLMPHLVRHPRELEKSDTQEL